MGQSFVILTVLPFANQHGLRIEYGLAGCSGAITTPYAMKNEEARDYLKIGKPDKVRELASFALQRVICAAPESLAELCLCCNARFSCFICAHALSLCVSSNHACLEC
jgi:hypothetical protein